MMSASRPFTFNAAVAGCAVCGERGRACSRCRVHYYCGKPHQKQHWPTHKAGCGVVEPRGGGIMAVKNIPVNTPFLRELPSLTFPASLSRVVTAQNPLSASPLVNTQIGPQRPAGAFAQLLCVGCCRDLTHERRPSQCRRCGLPVCHVLCGQSGPHYVECEAFQRAKFVVPAGHLRKLDIPLGAAVATLRAAVAIPGKPHLELLLAEMNFLDELSKVSTWTSGLLALIDRVVRYLRRTVGVTWIPEHDLHRAALMVAQFGTLRQADEKQTYEAMLYAGSSLRKHSCVPNSSDLTINRATHEIVLVTTKDIAAGEYITGAREGGNWVDHTLDRTQSLFFRWGFLCKCERCCDPTELGLYVGSPCCQDCARQGKKGYLICVNDVWQCESCKTVKIETEVTALTKAAKERLHELINLRGSPPEELLRLIDDYSYPRGPLHPTHAIVLHAKEAFRTHFNENGMELVEKLHDRWVDVLRDQLGAVDRLLPGMNIWRYMMLAQLRFFLLGHLYEAAHTIPSTSANDRQIKELKEYVLDLNRQICQYYFEHGEDHKIVSDPFTGALD